MLVKSAFEAALFDLDGVIVDTAKFHYLAWKVIAVEEGIYFNKQINERLKGVDRIGSLNIILEKVQKVYPIDKKIEIAEND